MIPSQTRNAIKSKYGKDTAERVAEQYNVSEKTVRNIWKEAKEGTSKTSPWTVPWLDPNDPDEGEGDANVLKMLQIAWYYKHQKAGLVVSQEQDYLRAYDLITFWNDISEHTKRLISYFLWIDVDPEHHRHEDGTPWTFEEWNAEYNKERINSVWKVFQADLSKTDDYRIHYPDVYLMYKGEIEYRPPFWTLEHFRKYRSRGNKYGKKPTLGKLFEAYGRGDVRTRTEGKRNGSGSNFQDPGESQYKEPWKIYGQ